LLWYTSVSLLAFVSCGDDQVSNDEATSWNSTWTATWENTRGSGDATQGLGSETGSTATATSAGSAGSTLGGESATSAGGTSGAEAGTGSAGTSGAEAGTGSAGTSGAGDSGTSEGVEETSGDSSSGEPVLDGCGNLGEAHEILRLLHLGTIQRVYLTGDRLVAWDERLSLWDAETGELLLASHPGRRTKLPVLGDEFFLMEYYETATSERIIEVRSLADGSLRTEVFGRYRLSGIPRDASYIWTYYDPAGVDEVSFWRPDGSFIRTVQGYEGYVQDGLTAAIPGAFLVAYSCPEDECAAQIHRIIPETGEVQMDPPWVGRFERFFEDGEHYLTRLGAEVRAYETSTGELVRTVEIESDLQVAGSAGYFWSHGGNRFMIYDVDGGEPVMREVPAPWWPNGSKTAIEMISGGVGYTIDLLDPALPITSMASPDVMAECVTGTATRWSVGANNGQVYLQNGNEPLQTLPGGSYAAYAGGRDGRLVLDTSGDLRVLDVASGSVQWAMPSSLSPPGVPTKVASDANVFALEEYLASGGVYDLDDGSLVFPVPVCNSPVRAWRLSDDGQTVARMCVVSTYELELWDVAEGTLRSTTAVADGAELTTINADASNWFLWSVPLLQFYVDGHIRAEYDGSVIGFLDPDTVFFDGLGGMVLRHATGAFIREISVPDETRSLFPIAEGRFYATISHAIYDAVGDRLEDWPQRLPASGRTAGVVAGSHAVHMTCAQRLVAVPYVPN